jgi:hypothetical protein
MSSKRIRNSQRRPTNPTKNQTIFLKCRLRILFLAACVVLAAMRSEWQSLSSLTTFYTSSRRRQTRSTSTKSYRDAEEDSKNNYLSSNMPHRYLSPLEEFPNQFNRTLPPPLQVIEQYMAWHSHDALLQDPHHRSFILAHYQCPISAGNWMHYLTSALLWGILTNRTLLWRYATNEICESLRVDWQYPFNPARCQVNTTQQDCHQHSVTRAPWIPSYDVWKDRLELGTPFRIPLEHSSSFGRQSRREPSSTDAATTSMHILPPPSTHRSMDVYYRKYPLIAIHPWAFLRLDHLVYRQELRWEQLGTVYAHATLQQLTQWGGPAFLFGLLWRSVLDYATPIRQQAMQHPAVKAMAKARRTGVRTTQHIPLSSDSSRSSPTEKPPIFSVALHSRHILSSDDGCNITMEQECLRNVLAEQQQSSQANLSSTNPCQVTLLSDRECTIANLTTWLQNELGCQAVTTQHSASVDVVFQEHGPYSGSGFFQDMLLASLTASSAMIGSLEPTDGQRWRSSSELVEEAMEYYRHMRNWQLGQTPDNVPELIQCTLRRMDLKEKPKPIDLLMQEMSKEQLSPDLPTLAVGLVGIRLPDDAALGDQSLMERRQLDTERTGLQIGVLKPPTVSSAAL